MAASEKSIPDNLLTRAARNVATATFMSSQRPAPLSAPPTVHLLKGRRWNHDGQNPSTLECPPEITSLDRRQSGGYRSSGISGGLTGGTLGQGVIRGDDFNRQGCPLAEQLSERVVRQAPHSEGRKSSARSSIQRLSFARDAESSGLVEALGDTTVQPDAANRQASACTLQQISGASVIRASCISLESSWDAISR